jgi:hypothetical protein
VLGRRTTAVKSQCNPRTDIGALGRRTIVANFSGEQISTEGGSVLLRLVEEKTGIVDRFVRCFRDHRDPRLIEHSVRDLVAQRVFGLALGYEDLVDHDALRKDPLLAAVVGKVDPENAPLAGKSTLNRLELSTDKAAEDRYRRIELDLAKAADFFVEQFLLSHAQQCGAPPTRIVLDLDPSDVPLYGNQEGGFYHGYYREYCYLPLYIYCGEFPLAVRLQTADGDPARHAVEELERIVPKIREAWPKVQILVRADSGFCRDEIFCWCEKNEVDYVIGVARNKRLEPMVEDELAEARKLHEKSGKPERVFKDLEYQTERTWSRSRRVVAKAEWLTGKANPRFVATTFTAEEVPAAVAYEDEYCPRGEMENRIKEQQLYLFGTRASVQTIRGNQIRFYFSAVAYMLVQAFRALGLKGTELAAARADTIRTKLLKIGARVTVTVRRVWVALSSACPYARTFVTAVQQLRTLPARN